MPLGLSFHELYFVYTKKIPLILEFAVPVWHSGLTAKQSAAIESVQKMAFRIILGKKYTTYTDATSFFSTQTLKQRRQTICLRFAKKNVDSENCLFTFPTPDPRLRPRNLKVNEFRCNTARFERSSLPYLASLINSQTWAQLSLPTSSLHTICWIDCDLWTMDICSHLNLNLCSKNVMHDTLPFDFCPKNK